MSRLLVHCLMFLFVIVIAYSSRADVASDLQKTFNDLNFTANVTGPGAYEDQRGGYYTGGSIFARAPVKNTDIANIQLPSYRAGCGGIDLYAGGMSYLKADELIKALKASVPNSLGYAFAMAMQTITPQLYNVLTELQGWVQKINSMNINSCETAALMVGGLWPKGDASSKYMCNTLGTSTGAVTDWVKGRHECGSEERRANINSNKAGGFQDQLGDEFNLVWKAINKNRFLSVGENRQLAEFFMSVSGTIVSRKKDNAKSEFTKKHFPSLAAKSDLIGVLMYGSDKGEAGKSSIYQCDTVEEDKCLYPTLHGFSLSREKALVTKVSDILGDLSSSVRHNNKAITNEQKGLIEMTSIPIMKILAIEVAFKEGKPPIQVLEFSEVIAFDILLGYLDEVLNLVHGSLVELQQVQIDDSTITQFKSEIRDARKQIAEKKHGLFQRVVTMISATERTQQMENQLQHMFSQASDVS